MNASLATSGPTSSWLPQPDAFADLAADQQTGDPTSTLELYRSLLSLRRARGLGAGSLALLDLGPDLVGADITSPAGTTRLVINLGPRPWAIPVEASVLICSETGTSPTAAQHLHTDQAVLLDLP